MPKRSALQAVLEEKCPKCRKGDLFKFSPLKLNRFDKMYSHCPYCNLRYNIEPGFFIGAMYISYAIVVSLMFAIGFFVYYVFSDPAMWVYLISFPSVIILLLPFIFRYSRVIYLYMAGGVSYNKNL